MKALVTGANGLIGAHLLRALAERDHDARGLVRQGALTTHIQALPYRPAVGDVLDVDSLMAAAQDCELIFHTAVPFTYWGPELDAVTKVAVEGSRNVLAAAAKARVRRVVMTSSSVTLGASAAPEVRDETASAADDPAEPAYVRAKIAQEREALETAARLGVELVIACPTMSMGPYGASLGPSNAVITSYLADPLGLTWPGGLNVVSARDVAAGHLLLAERGQNGERYVLGSENLTWAAAHALIADLAGVARPRATATAVACLAIAAAEEARARLTGGTPLATRAQARMVGRYYWYSHARAAALGYSPRPARAALADALAWLAASPHVSREMRTRLRLARETHQAREAARAADLLLTAVARCAPIPPLEETRG